MTPPSLPDEFLKLPLAHRALHSLETGAIENSAKAIGAAVEAGYGIEIDVQLSSDFEAIVFHDSSLDRLTGESGPVRERSASDLRSIRLNGSDDTIQPLSVILDLIAGKVPLLIELKDQSGGNGLAPDHLERAVVRDLAAYDGPAALMAFNPYMVANLKGLAPNIARGLTTDHFSEADWPDLDATSRRALQEIEAFDQTGASFISHNWRDLHSNAVTGLKARGVPILCWTVTSVEAERKAREVADNITFEGYRASFYG